MVFEISDSERKLLSSLKEGLSRILIYSINKGGYPFAVSFVLRNNKTVTIRARGEDIAPRFEVFPVLVTETVIKSEPAKVVDCKAENQHLKVSILQKSEWSVPASEEEKAQMLGDPVGSTMQYEGKARDIPDNAIERATLHAGVEIEDSDGWIFLVATSMSAWTLYVSECDFSESFDPSVYERLELSKESAS